MPAPDASNAAASAVRRARSGSKLATSASGTGKMVRWPWMMSAAKIRGIFSRDSLTAAFCRIRAMRRAIAVEHAGELALARFVDLLLKIRPVLGGLSDSAAPPPQADAIRLQLPGLLLERHAADQRVDEAGNVELAGRLRGALAPDLPAMRRLRPRPSARPCAKCACRAFDFPSTQRCRAQLPR